MIIGYLIVIISPLIKKLTCMKKKLRKKNLIYNFFKIPIKFCINYSKKKLHTYTRLTLSEDFFIKKIFNFLLVSNFCAKNSNTHNQHGSFSYPLKSEKIIFLYSLVRKKIKKISIYTLYTFFLFFQTSLSI